jgi:hypothetical protein
MKTMPRGWPVHGIELLVVIFVGLASPCLAQIGSPPTNTTIPTVTIRATDPVASESGHTGTFTLFRDGPTNTPLNVYYLIGGTASNGVDYASLSQWSLIPAGARTATITITPIDDALVEGTEYVELRLAQSAILPPVNYMIGNPSNAVVYILDNDGTNVPPTVHITIPTNGASFTAPANIYICADARDADGHVARVEFFANGASIGSRTNCLPCANPGNPFCLYWPGVPAGDYVLTAQATDDGGATTISDPVAISVEPGTTSNLPPVVRIISPANGAAFRAPVNIPIYAYSHDADGSVLSVEFFADTTSLGFGHRVSASAGSAPGNSTSNYFFLVWSNAPVGVHPLTAKATDDDGASTTSDPVKVTILPPLPPPTNRPAIVTIVATDPIAIEGTNCWPWIGPTNSSITWSNWPGATAACRFFTNCGPKNATFTIRRDGATNAPLTVTYAVGGTASNGVEYLTLPGSATIPAGERRALITVVPLDDGPPDLTSTVVLILDGKWPHPLTSALPDRCFHLNASGPDGAWFRIEYSTNLRDWIPICNNQVIQGSIDFVDPDAQTDQTRLYRAVPINGPPAE